MKRQQQFLAILGSSLTCASIASPVGNPSAPCVLEEGFFVSDQSWFSIRGGVNGDLLFQKRLRASPESENLNISHSEVNWKIAACDIGWTLRERFDLHVITGPVVSSDLYWQQEGARYSASSDQGLFWGSSASIIILDVEDTTLGLDAQGGGISWLEGPLTRNAIAQEKGFNASVHFWQVAVGLSQNLGPLRPYIGGVCNHLFYILNAPSKIRLQDLLAYGTYEGCSLSFGSRFSLNVEARQFFESGLSLSGELRF